MRRKKFRPLAKFDKFPTVIKIEPKRIRHAVNGILFVYVTKNQMARKTNFHGSKITNYSPKYK